MSRFSLSVVSVACGFLLVATVVAAYGLMSPPAQVGGAPQVDTPAPPVSGAVARCGGTHNDVMAEIDLRKGQDFWQVFPAALRAPEMESDTGPVHLVVFRGPFNTDDLAMGGAPGFQQPRELENVVCAILSDDSMVLYANVSRVGSQFAQ